MIPMERASQEEQNGTNFSFVAPSSEELRVRKETRLKPWTIVHCNISKQASKHVHYVCSHVRIHLQYKTHRQRFPSHPPSLPSHLEGIVALWSGLGGLYHTQLKGSLGEDATMLRPGEEAGAHVGVEGTQPRHIHLRLGMRLLCYNIRLLCYSPMLYIIPNYAPIMLLTFHHTTQNYMYIRQNQCLIATQTAVTTNFCRTPRDKSLLFSYTFRLF